MYKSIALSLAKVKTYYFVNKTYSEPVIFLQSIEEDETE